MKVAESFTRRRLPHWDMPDAAYFLTTCLQGSIPAEGLLDVERYRRQLERQACPKDQTETEWRRNIAKRCFARRDSWLDNKPAVRHLADSRLASIVVDALYWFAGERYDLLAFVVMPSHIHWVFQPLSAWIETLPESGRSRSPRQRIQHSIDRYTAQRCNEARAVTGPFWQRESYDHWVRDADELERIIRYIEANPVNAGLVASPQEWLFSSAHDRLVLQLEFGEPLARRRR